MVPVGPFALINNFFNWFKDVFISRDPGNILERIFRDPVTQVLNDTGSQPLLFENNIRSTLDDYFEGNYSDTWNSTLVTNPGFHFDPTELQ